MASPAMFSESARPSALIVEDEVLIGRYLAEMLEELGFNASAVCTFEEALKITSTQGQFTVAFVDLALPGRTGLELISELKTHFPDLPVVIASGYGAMAKRDADDASDHPLVLCKPYDAKVVATVLTKLGIHIPNAPNHAPGSVS